MRSREHHGSCSPSPVAAAAALRSPAAAATTTTRRGNAPRGDAADGHRARRLGDVTLIVWDQEVRGGQAEAIKKLNAQFQRLYPNIKIKRTAKSFTDLLATLKLAASGPEPARRRRGEQRLLGDGPARPGRAAAAARRVLADRNNWRDRYSPRDPANEPLHATTARTSARGSLYGLPMIGEVVGVYYNKAKLRELGLELPTTFEEFEAALATAKAGGETPIQFGNLDKWPGIHAYEETDAPVRVDKELRAARGSSPSPASELRRTRATALAATKLAGVGEARATSPTATPGSATTRRGSSSARAKASS